LHWSFVPLYVGPCSHTYFQYFSLLHWFQPESTESNWNPGIPVEWTGLQLHSYPFLVHSKENIHYKKQINHIPKNYYIRKNNQNSTKWSFCRCSTGITAQYFLLIFEMLIQVNQKHLLAPFPWAENGHQNKNILKAPTFTQISSYQGKCNTTT